MAATRNGSRHKRMPKKSILDDHFEYYLPGLGSFRRPPKCDIVKTKKQRLLPAAQKGRKRGKLATVTTKSRDNVKKNVHKNAKVVNRLIKISPKSGKIKKRRTVQKTPKNMCGPKTPKDMCDPVETSETVQGFPVREVVSLNSKPMAAPMAEVSSSKWQPQVFLKRCDAKDLAKRRDTSIGSPESTLSPAVAKKGRGVNDKVESVHMKAVKRSRVSDEDVGSRKVKAVKRSRSDEHENNLHIPTVSPVEAHSSGCEVSQWLHPSYSPRVILKRAELVEHSGRMILKSKIKVGEKKSIQESASPEDKLVNGQGTGSSPRASEPLLSEEQSLNDSAGVEIEDASSSKSISKTRQIENSNSPGNASGTRQTKTRPLAALVHEDDDDDVILVETDEIEQDESPPRATDSPVIVLEKLVRCNDSGRLPGNSPVMQGEPNPLSGQSVIPRSDDMANPGEGENSMPSEENDQPAKGILNIVVEDGYIPEESTEINVEGETDSASDDQSVTSTKSGSYSTDQDKSDDTFGDNGSVESAKSPRTDKDKSDDSNISCQILTSDMSDTSDTDHLDVVGDALSVEEESSEIGGDQEMDEVGDALGVEEETSEIGGDQEIDEVGDTFDVEEETSEICGDQEIDEVGDTLGVEEETSEIGGDQEMDEEGDALGVEEETSEIGGDQEMDEEEDTLGVEEEASEIGNDQENHNKKYISWHSLYVAELTRKVKILTERYISLEQEVVVSANLLIDKGIEVALLKQQLKKYEPGDN